MQRLIRARLRLLSLALTGLLLVAGLPGADAAAVGTPSLRVASANAAVRATWTAPTGTAVVTGYDVSSRRYRTVAGTWTPWSKAVVGRTVRSRMISVPNGTRVQVRVRARHRAGAGRWSPTVAQRAGLPGAVPGTEVLPGEEGATVSWTTAPGHGSTVTGYRVYRRARVSGAWSPWSSVLVASTARNQTFTGLVNDKPHQFQVRAVNRWGPGEAGATVSATPRDVAPEAVTSLALTKASWATIALSWTNPAIPDLAAIVVRRAAGDTAPATITDGTGIALGGAAATSAQDTDLPESTTYAYSVFVVDDSGKVSAPRSLVVTTQPPPLTVQIEPGARLPSDDKVYQVTQEGQWRGFTFTAAASGTGIARLSTASAVGFHRTARLTPFQSDDGSAPGFVSVSHGSCSAAQLSGLSPFTGMPTAGDVQYVDIAYTCDEGEQFSLNYYPNMTFWECITPTAPCQGPFSLLPDDVWTFPVTVRETPDGPERAVVSPTLRIFNDPVIVDLPPMPLYVKPPQLLTSATKEAPSTEFPDGRVVLETHGYDGEGIPVMDTLTVTAAQPLTGTGGLQLVDPDALLTGRSIVITPIEVTGCVETPVWPCGDAFGTVEIIGGPGAFQDPLTGQHYDDARILVPFGFSGVTTIFNAALVCRSLGGEFQPSSEAGGAPMECRSWEPGGALFRDLGVERLRAPDVCPSGVVTGGFDEEYAWWRCADWGIPH